MLRPRIGHDAIVSKSRSPVSMVVSVGVIVVSTSLLRRRLRPLRNGRVGSAQVLSGTYVAISVVGAVRAVRTQREVQFAGLRLPGTPRTQAFTIGTPLSAPPVMLIALVVATRRRRTDVVTALAGMFLVGVLGERDTYAVARRPWSDPLSTMCAVLEATLPIAMLHHGWRGRLDRDTITL